MPNRPTAIAEELKQTRPFATSEEEAIVSVLRSAAVIRRVLGQRIDPFGISPAQYNVLRILRGAGPEGLPTLAVRDRLVEEAPGITRLIDKLESATLVRRDRTGKDRRTVRCHITAAGLALLAKADACEVVYLGTVKLNDMETAVGIEPDQMTYLKFVFKRTETFGGAALIDYTTVITPRLGVRYAADVSYIDRTYYVKVMELDRNAAPIREFRRQGRDCPVAR